MHLREGVHVASVAADHAVTDAGTRPFDVCVWSTGFAFSSLPDEAGLDVDARGRVRVDAHLRSISHPDVYAVGDIAVPTWHPLPMGCKSAQPMGAHAAENLARRARGREELPFDFAAPLFCVSLGRRDGLIQLARRDGALTGRVVRGRAGAWIKEIICRWTLFALRLERRRVAAVVWLGPGKARRLPRSTGLLQRTTRP